MPIIETKTFLNAPIEVCFNIARDAKDIVSSVPPIKNSIIDSKLTKQVQLGDRFYIDHLFLKEKITYTTKYNVIEFVPPFKFSEEFTSVFFSDFKYIHEFIQKENGTLMIDTIEYTMALGPIGKYLEKKYIEELIRRYMYNRIKHVHQKTN